MVILIYVRYVAPFLTLTLIKDIAFLSERNHQLVLEQAAHIALGSIQCAKDSAKSPKLNQPKKRCKLSEFEVLLATRVSKGTVIAEQIAHSTKASKNKGTIGGL